MSHWETADISSRYATYRPTYPEAMFDRILAEMKASGVAPGLALDVGCGTGQAAEPLLSRFKHVMGVDPSKTQVEECRRFLEASVQKKRLTTKVDAYVGDASGFGLPDGTSHVDLITVGQAMHWFDMVKFSREVDRVLRPGGFLAVAIYTTPRLDPAPCDAVLQELDKFLMTNGYWPKERKHIDDEYVNLIPQLPYPLDKKICFDPVEPRTVDSVVNYVSTWSGLNQYVKKTGHKTRLDELRTALTQALGNGELKLRLPVKLFLLRKPIGAKL